MNLRLVSEREAPLLNRRRIHFEVDFPKAATPKKEDVLRGISLLLNIKEELIAIRHVYQHFGVNRAVIIAHVYKNINDLKNTEEIKKKVKAEKKEKKKEVKEDAKETKAKEQKAK